MPRPNLNPSNSSDLENRILSLENQVKELNGKMEEAKEAVIACIRAITEAEGHLNQQLMPIGDFYGHKFE